MLPIGLSGEIRMKKHVHGGNVYKYQNCIDFSANCNPLGTPKSVKQAIIESVEHISDYPQVGYEPLRKAIADDEAVSTECVICGNGAAELIFSLCLAVSPKKALILAPTFAEYEQALASVGCLVSYYFLKEEKDFRIQEDFLQRLTPELDVVFLCNPNNPTGILTERAFLLRVLEQCQRNGILLVVDECFQDFIRKPEAYTLKEQIQSCDNLFLLKAFTKRYAMAGVRLGYGICGNARLLDWMMQVTQPWNVSSMAQAAGMAALNETEYVEKGRQLIFEEAEYLRLKLTGLGLKVYPSQANYLFFKGAEGFFEDCVKEGVLIRDCSNYPGLTDGYYRIAVKKHEDNVRLIGALQKILDMREGRA